jgi:Kef-type K+ transport system membrane component KefB
VDPHTDILAILALILVAGKLAGQAGKRLGLPTPVGKICVGLVIGPALLGLVTNDGSIETLSEIGLVLLMFLAGLETDMVTLRQVRVPALAAAAGGVMLPFAGGVGLGYLFDLGLAETLFLGAILTATSVSISAQTLRELGRLQSREGTTILAAAVIDDVMGVAVLAFVFAVAGDGNPVESLARMALFLPLAFVVGQSVIPWAGKRIAPRLSTETQLAVVIAVALAYGWAAEELGGVAAVTGAYIAGVLVAQSELPHAAMDGLSTIANSFFVPLFFVAIGLQANFGSLAESPWLVVSLLVVAVLAKILGSGAGALVARFSAVESLRVGAGMVSRGEVALVIAAAGLEAGAVDETLFSAAVIMALVTTIVTPLMLKVTYSNTLLQRARLGGLTREEGVAGRREPPPGQTMISPSTTVQVLPPTSARPSSSRTET